MTSALLCQTVTGRTMAELVAARDAAGSADLVELRLDGVSDPDVPRAIEQRPVPVIVTCRPVWEGGHFNGPEEERKRLLRQALEHGADYVDIEWAAGFSDLVDRFAPRVVLSSHDFTGVPADLRARARAMRQTGAGTIKLAVAAKRLSDTLPLLEIAREGPAVVLGMGDAGVPSRLLASRFGSRWSYAGDGVAPGQMAARRMTQEFRFRETTAGTKLYGVVGNNVIHSLSPAMHNAAFAEAGLDSVYVPLPAADFDDFLTFAAALGVDGASVTIPFKVDALTGGRPDVLARQVGAANTLSRRQDGWDASNTDVAGFLEPLEVAYQGSLRDVRAAVLGDGGVARAAVVALRSRLARVTVYARHATRARAAFDGWDVNVAAWPPPPRAWDLLVNCTPLGSSAAPDESPLPDGPFDGHFVYDLTYGPGRSPFITAAERAGCLTLDGLPMLVAQAERQFEAWTGRRPAAGVMSGVAQQGVTGLRRQAGVGMGPERSHGSRDK